MHISVEDLKNNEKFTLIHVLSLEDIVQFVFHQIRILNPVTVLFFTAIGLSFFYMVLIFFHGLLPGRWGLVTILFHIICGFVIWPIMLIPIHELLHAFVYKVAGAPSLKFGFKPEKFLFFVSADNYVIEKKWFLPVAFTPFIIISGILILLNLLFSYPIAWSFSVCLFVHTTMCIGDFALAGFFAQLKGKEVYTYDDVENSKTYFYVHKSNC